MIEHKKICHEDQRGTIRDIFVDSPRDHCTIIVSRPGAVRGNHFHRRSTQYTYVVSGTLTMVVQGVDESGKALGEPHVSTMVAGDLAKHVPLEAHAFRSEDESVILAFADGVRGGEAYELDVYRLSEPLL
jgi:dTDP-4-dehydrorhamnose 3,5-epimerase-like enzyme